MRRVLSMERLDTFEQKKQLNPPRPKYPAPSTKNGRFSSKKVSNAERFTTAGSTSTCPKSGFTVAFNVRLEVTRYIASPPTRPSIACGSKNGSLRSPGMLDDRPTMYGVTSARPGGCRITRPLRCPNMDGPPVSSSRHHAHCDSSFSRFSCRQIWSPQVWRQENRLNELSQW